MRLVCRAFAMTVSLALVARWGGSAFAGPAPPTPPMDERQIRRWSDWWVNEVLRQSLPTPQLLYFHSYPGRPRKSDFRMGGIWAPEEYKILYLYPLNPSDNVDSHQYQTNTDWLNTEAFVMPSASGIQNDYSYYEARRMNQPVTHHSYARLQLSPNKWDMPVFSLRLPEEYAGPFSWAKNIRAPATVCFAAFSETQFEVGDFLRLPFPNQNWWLEQVISHYLQCPFFETGVND